MTLPLHYHDIFVQCVLILNRSQVQKILKYLLLHQIFVLAKKNHGRGRIVYSN